MSREKVKERNIPFLGGFLLESGAVSVVGNVVVV
jgi:hypothetical protein